MDIDKHIDVYGNIEGHYVELGENLFIIGEVNPLNETLDLYWKGSNGEDTLRMSGVPYGIVTYWGPPFTESD